MAENNNDNQQIYLDVAKELFRDAYCPITEEVMRDPVMLIESGHTYERKAIEEWLFRRGCRTDPLTNQKLRHLPKLVPNITLKKLIDTWQHHKQIYQQLESPRDEFGSSSSIIREVKLNNGGLIISPQHLCFQRFPNIQQDSTLLLSLTNIQSYPIAFKIKTRNPEIYSIHPSKQIIQPGTFLDLKVTVIAQNESPEDIYNFRDKLLVQQVPINPNQIGSVSEVFRQNSDQKMESKIKVKYSFTVGAGDLVLIPSDLEFKPKTDHKSQIQIQNQDQGKNLYKGSSSEATLFLCNQNSERIAFKIKTRLPTKYFVRPGKGFIESNQIMQVRINIPHNQDVSIDVKNFKDKILVQSVVVQQNDDEFKFEKLGQDCPGVVDSKLGVVLV